MATKKTITDYHIGVRELKNQLTRIVRIVREQQVEFVVTVHGQPVAVLRSYTEADAARIQESAIEQELEELQTLSELVTAAWKSADSGVTMLEQMREESAWR